MNYASRLGLVHFMQRDPNGIRRDPRWCDIMNYASRLGLVYFMQWDPNGIRRDPRWGVRGIVLLV